MKLRKSKLIISTFCLTAAISLAVFTVYAWFVIFKEVNIGTIDTVVTSGDVTYFDIDYYYTTSEKVENKIEFTIGDKIPADAETQKRQMRDYTPRANDNGASTTAVLLDLTLKFSRDGVFTLTARNTHGDNVYSVPTDNTDTNLQAAFDEFSEKNYLSNVVFLQKVSITESTSLIGKKFNITDPTQYNFITSNGVSHYFDGKDDKDKKNAFVDLPTYTVNKNATGNQEHHIYLLMEYMTPQINSLYYVMLQLFPGKATLSTPINFQNDIFFEVGRANS